MPASGLCQPESAVIAAAVPTEPRVSETTTGYIPDDPTLPVGVMDLMRSSQLTYQQGSALLKAGESAKAREAFNKAVDQLLQANWDLSTTPALKQFFQDLICRIQQDESRYLQPNEVAEEPPEEAVLDELDKLDLIPITVDPSLKDVVEADLANSKYDIPIMLNDKVLKSLDYWLNRGRKFFVDGLLRSGMYRDMIERVFHEYSIPKDIMYLAQVESLFKPHALSRAQCKGIWQFEKWTAIRYGLKVNSYVDERSDPEKSTRAAARYLTDLYGMFKDWALVLAAYNWGEANVQKLINRTGVDDFWDLMDLRRNFPEETKNHVPLIMASIILARNPEKYGLPKDLQEPIPYDRVPVSKPIDLRSAARLMNVSFEYLKQLNPALRGVTTPAGYANFELHVPAGSDAKLGQQLAALPAVTFRPVEETAVRRHKVQPRETAARIAARYHVSVTALQRANKLKASKPLRAGTWLTIPGKAQTAAAKSSIKSSRITRSIGNTRIARTSPASGSKSRKASVTTKTTVRTARLAVKKTSTATAASAKGASSKVTTSARAKTSRRTYSARTGLSGKKPAPKEVAAR